MEKILLDTVHLRQDFPLGSIIRLRDNDWGKGIETNKGQRPVTCFRVSEDGVALRVYENIYKVNRLVIIVSIPRAARGNNYNNITKTELLAFYDKVYNVLNKYIAVNNPLQLLLTSFQVVRCDLFHMQWVPAHLKEEYLNAFSKLHLGQYVTEQCGDTAYYKSSKHYYGKKTPASVVACFYDKEMEMYQKEYAELHSEFEAVQGELLQAQRPNSVRIEIRLMRQKLRRLFNSKSVTLQDILNPVFQREVLDSYFDRFRLYDEILYKDEYYAMVPTLFKYKPSQANAIDFADSIRTAKSPVTLSPNQIRYIREVLHQNQIHYVTTPKYTLAPLDRQAVFSNGVMNDIIGEAAEAALQTVLKHQIVSDIDEPFVFLS